MKSHHPFHINRTAQPHVVIVGGGFGGLYAAKALGNQPVQVTLIDRRNFHLFQPLLYQVATGGLSPGDIASPLRAILNRFRNITVIQDEVRDIFPDEKRLQLSASDVCYDVLILSTGVSHHYFGNDAWARLAPGLKTIEDALEIRRRIFMAFEAAEKESDPQEQQAWLTFVVVGGGPTGVELAGALAELARHTLRRDFRFIRPTDARIYLIEATERILPTFPEKLSRQAEKSLTRLGVTVKTRTRLTEIFEDWVTWLEDGRKAALRTHTVLWAAGVRASGVGEWLRRKTGVPLDRNGRVMVRPDLSLPDYPEIFVIGDLAHLETESGQPLPGIAPVAMQQGRYVARRILRALQGKSTPAFRYRDKGSLAVIGRNQAVARFRKWQLAGFPAWLAWLFVHIWYLIEFDNKLLVLFQWAWDYFTRKKGARLITGEPPFPAVRHPRSIGCDAHDKPE
ncbi:MAG: NAD(P)/FAD-dependent oxidoreductase [Calditrichaeota bacterium]|nr:NAD(P)/FAD-dependent oxidoreductase [Calditrichota bacterium]